MRYFFHIAYHGQEFNGWQRQKNSNSIQVVIEDAFRKVLKTNIGIFGCGRTDAGVHSSQFFFHADIENSPDLDQLLFRVNKALPQSIAIFDIIPMQGEEHARFDAIQRKYDYFMHTYKDPHLSSHSSFYLIDNLNLQAMKRAVDLLPLYSDYRSFCTHPDKYEHTICQVSHADLFVNDNENRIRFHISSNRFLGKMIRILMGKLILIGKNRLSVDEFESYLISLEIPKLLLPAYPNGLYLSKIIYPYLDLAPKSDFLLSNQTNDWHSI